MVQQQYLYQTQRKHISSQSKNLAAIQCDNVDSDYTKHMRSEAHLKLSPFVFLRNPLADALSSCSTTFWDPHWDPRLRRLIHDTFQPHYEDFALRRSIACTMTAAFEQDACTTLEDAKRLITQEAACLRSFTAAQREIFLGKLAAADV
jgi:hypothetical protein